LPSHDTDTKRLFGIYETQRLLHIDNLILVEFSIQVSTLYVDLMNFKILSNSNSKDSSDRCELGNCFKCVKIINARDLEEALSNKSSLVMDYVSSCILLHFVHSLGPNDIDIFWRFDKLPGICIF